MLRKVLKRIPSGDGEYIESGTILDVSTWRNVRTLENGRYLTTVTDEEAQAFAEAQKPAPKATTKKSKTSSAKDEAVAEEDDK
jgi:hypothetical protein